MRHITYYDKKYAVFDDRDDTMVFGQLFNTEIDAEIAAREHDLTQQGVDWYVSAVQYDKNSDSYYPFFDDGSIGIDPTCDHACGYELDHSDNSQHCYICGAPIGD